MSLYEKKNSMLKKHKKEQNFSDLKILHILFLCFRYERNGAFESEFINYSIEILEKDDFSIFPYQP